MAKPDCNLMKMNGFLLHWGETVVKILYDTVIYMPGE